MPKTQWPPEMGREMLLAELKPMADDKTLRHAFRNVDDLDWQHLYKFIPYSGHGKFWMKVFDEARAALNLSPGNSPNQSQITNDK